MPVLALGFVTGVTFATGLPGILVFVLLASLWGFVTGAGAYHGNVFERAAFKGEQFG